MNAPEIIAIIRGFLSIIVAVVVITRDGFQPSCSDAILLATLATRQQRQQASPDDHASRIHTIRAITAMRQ